ncbi:MAG: lysophospholipid acyltransferase family protein [Candidatus Dormibacteria bacterium]
MSNAVYNRRRLLGFGLANAVFGGLPRQASYVLMAVVGWIVATLFPGRVAGLRANLKHVFPDYTEAQITDLMQRNAKNYGKFWVDLFKMPRLPLDYKLTLASIDGRENLDKVMARGKGAVVVTIHMGGWEGASSWWGSNSQWHTSLIAEKLEPPELWDRVLALRESSGLTVIPLTLTAARDILRRLRHNEMVTGAIDRDLTGTGRPFQFFDSTINVPTGLFDIANRTGAGVLPVICYRKPDDRYVFVGMEPLWVGDEPGAIDTAVTAVLGQFEACIRRFPDQWHVMVPIFKEDAQPVSTTSPPARVAVYPDREQASDVELEERVG